MKLHSYDVLGQGNFPTDMLRYDCCWPSTEEGCVYISDRIPFPKLVEDKALIRIMGIKAPTVARWKSFGWEVIKE